MSEVINQEIHCEEKKGGMSFELRLAEPIVQTPPTIARAGSPPKELSAEQIEAKLRAAEERRKSLTASQMAALTTQLSRIEDARVKTEEQERLFIQQTDEALKTKIAKNEENRETHIKELKEKMKKHLEDVAVIRENLAKQTAEVSLQIKEKLETAANLRDEHLKSIVEKLRVHEEQTKKVKESNEEKMKNLKTRIDTKLVTALQRRLSIEDEMRQKIKQQEEKAEQVRQKKMIISKSDDSINAEGVETAPAASG